MVVGNKKMHTGIMKRQSLNITFGIHECDGPGD